MAAGISLRQIAYEEGVSYQLVARWAKKDGWIVVRKAHPSAGIPALYHFGAVQAYLADRETAKAKVAA